MNLFYFSDNFNKGLKRFNKSSISQLSQLSNQKWLANLQSKQNRRSLHITIVTITCGHCGDNLFITTNMSSAKKLIFKGCYFKDKYFD